MAVFDFLIIGGGIVGLCISIEIKKAFGGSVCIIEKEGHIGAHASGRNSGVLHAGIYYKPNTLKGRLSVQGHKTMKEYCDKKGLSQIKGKVIVTQSEKQLDSLMELNKRARANGAEVHLIDEKELKEIEPYARTVEKAIYSPNTVVTDPREVLKSLLDDANALGIKVLFDTRMTGIEKKDKIRTNNGTLSYGFLINAAGAYADKIAHMFDVGKRYIMLPYKGVYYRLKDNYSHLVRSNIYPVPDIRYPFLGVHFTRTPSGNVKIGPTAIPALSRENYGAVKNVKFNELIDCLRYNAIKLLTDKNYLSMGVKEVSKYTRYLYYRNAKHLMPALKYSYLTSYPNTGIRAQLFDKQNRKLENDFLIEKQENTLHVLNAVSPAYTTAITFAKYVTSFMKMG